MYKKSFCFNALLKSFRINRKGTHYNNLKLNIIQMNLGNLYYTQEL
jgi:hypothetical protein